MKKSFMTRVLAMGLSFAMAFSLSAATNVTTASAAAKKVGVTTMMKVSTKSVTEGKTVKTYMNSTALKKYRIKKVAKLSAVADKYIDVDVITTGKKARQGLEITAHEGAVTAAKLTKKGVYVTIYFAQTTSATKAAKATAKKYAKLKVAVQAKPVEKLTMTAAATKVKEITVTFNKAVDDTTAKLTVKKNTASPVVDTVKFDDTKKVAKITMAGKLTAGTYTVTAVVGDETITADAVVEKNETLTTFKLVGNTLKAKNATETTTASINFQALNQYEEAMSCSGVTATVAPGKADPQTVSSTASKDGTITVKDIPDMYAIPGAEFQILLIDQSGVTFKGTAVYGMYAKAAKVESAGLYNKNKGKFMDMTEGDKVADYVALFTVTDQYGDPYTIKKEEVTGTANIIVSPISGVTNVKVGTFSATDEPIREVDGKKYFEVPLVKVDTGAKDTAVAGEFGLNLVNNLQGAMGLVNYTVKTSTEIKTLSISADAIYGGQDNTLSYTATDMEGNEITKYDILKGVLFTGAAGAGTIKFEKNADGSATLKWLDTPSVPEGLKSTMSSFTAQANQVTGNHFVQTYTFTYLADRKATAVVGINKSIATSTAASGDALKIPFKKLLIEDQYGNVFTEAELKAGTLVSANSVYVTGASIELMDTASPGAWVVSGNALTTSAASGAALTNSSTGEFAIIAPATTSALNATVKFYVQDNINEAYSVTYKKVASSDLNKVSGLKIESVNKGFTLHADNTASLGANIVTTAATQGAIASGHQNNVNVVVSGYVNGSKYILNSSQAEAKISFEAIKGYGSNVANIETKDATVTVIVSTADGPVTLTETVKISNAPGVATTVEAKSDLATKDAISAVTMASECDKAYTIQDQYGSYMSGSDADKFEISVTKVEDVTNPSDVKDITNTYDTSKVDIQMNGMKGANIKVSAGKYKVTCKVTVTLANGKTDTFTRVYTGE